MKPAAPIAAGFATSAASRPARKPPTPSSLRLHVRNRVRLTPSLGPQRNNTNRQEPCRDHAQVLRSPNRTEPRRDSASFVIFRKEVFEVVDEVRNHTELTAHFLLVDLDRIAVPITPSSVYDVVPRSDHGL